MPITSSNSVDSETSNKMTILEAALKVFTLQEINSMPKSSQDNLGILIGRRLDQAGPPPTHAELVGIRDLLENHLTLPGLGWNDNVDQFH